MKASIKILILTIMIIINLLSIPIVSSEGLADSPWPCYGGNPQRTGVSPYNTSDNPGEVKWSFKTGDMIRSSPIIGPDGNIYFGANDGYLYSITSDGKERWSLKLTKGDLINEIVCSPTISEEGFIYIAVEGYFYSINQEGDILWEYYIGEYSRSSPIIYDDTIYVGSGEEDLYAMNPDGTVKWNFDTKYRVASPPAIDKDGIIYFSEEDYEVFDCSLYAVYPNGTKKWEFNISEGTLNSPVIGNNGIIYTPSSVGKLYAINPNGTEKWSLSIEGSPKSLSIGSDGTLYTGTGVVTGGDEKLVAIDPDGSIIWTYNVDGPIYLSPSISSDGTIYFGSRDGNIYAINPNGDLKWKYLTKGPIQCSSAINSDGTVYIGSYDNKLYSFGEKSEDNNNGSPGFQMISFTTLIVSTAILYSIRKRTK